MRWMQWLFQCKKSWKSQMCHSPLNSVIHDRRGMGVLVLGVMIA